MRTLAIVVCALASAIALGACGESDRDRVAAYVEQVNEVQRRAQPAFERASEMYRDYSQSRLRPVTATYEFGEAERAIRDARRRLGLLLAPAPAAVLHRRMLGVFDANAALARETTLLARYLPRAQEAVAPLPGISSRLRRRLASTSSPQRQSRALLDYAGGLSGMLLALRRLQPPPILASTHRAQITRLTSARTLSHRLRAALRERDARRVAELLLRFRRLNAARTRERVLSNRAIRAYRERLRALTIAAQDAQRERNRLERELG